MEDLKKLKVKNWKEIAKERRTWRDLAENAKTHKGLQCQMMIQRNCDIVTSFKEYNVWKLQLQMGIVKFSCWNLSRLYMSFERICEDLLQYKDHNFAQILILFIKTHRSDHVVPVLTA